MNSLKLSIHAIKIFMEDFKIYPGMCDSHTHLLEMQKKNINLKELLESLNNMKMGWLMDAGVDETRFEERLSWKKHYPHLFFSAGLHPGSCGESEAPLDVIAKQLDHPDVQAVGEIGLDYYWDNSKKELQKRFFRKQLQMAKEKNLPVIIHNRDADSDILQILKEEDIHRGVIHCFSSNREYARYFLDQGFYISFAGNCTYKKATGIQEAAAMVPDDRLLVETDAPYLTAQAMRGRLNTPGFLGYTVDFIAEIRGNKPEEIYRVSRENFFKLFDPS